MNKPTVSVVIPCYNAAPFLRETLDSALAQTHAPLEIIVIDDGSTDDSATIAASYGPPVRVIRQKNQGAAAARCRGAQVARGSHVAFTDAGDLALPNRNAVLADALRRFPQSVMSFGVARNLEHDNAKSPYSTGGELDDSCTLLEDAFRQMIRKPWPLASAMNILVERTALLKALRIPGFYVAANDYALQLRVASLGSCVHVATVSAAYKIQVSGLTETHGLIRQIGFALCSAHDCLRYYGEPRVYSLLWRDRVESDWPRIATGLAACRDWKLWMKCFRVAAPYVRWHRMPRRIWWAMDDAKRRGMSLTLPFRFAYAVGLYSRDLTKRLGYLLSA